MQALETALLREPSIASVALASHFPGSGEYWRTAPYFAAEGQRDADAPRLSEVFMDSTLLTTMGLELLEGRLPQSPREVVVTENALDTFGWASYDGKQLFNREEALTVVGVAPDVGAAADFGRGERFYGFKYPDRHKRSEAKYVGQRKNAVSRHARYT